MKMLIGAIALFLAAPVAAQTAPAPAPKADCCEKMKAEGKECCCEKMDHSKMDHSKHDSSGERGHEGHAH
jgi:hypothetical protein